MVVCKRSSNGAGELRQAAPESSNGKAGHKSRLGEGGPVFLPRRKLSAISEALLAAAPKTSACGAASGPAPPG